MYLLCFQLSLSISLYIMRCKFSIDFNKFVGIHGFSNQSRLQNVVYPDRLSKKEERYRKQCRYGFRLHHSYIKPDAERSSKTSIICFWTRKQKRAPMVSVEAYLERIGDNYVQI